MIALGRCSNVTIYNPFISKSKKKEIKFVLAGCKACYVRETISHFSMPLKEYLGSDSDWFRVLDYSSSSFQLKIKEAIHIQGNNPL